MSSRPQKDSHNNTCYEYDLAEQVATSFGSAYVKHLQGARIILNENWSEKSTNFFSLVLAACWIHVI